MDKNKAAKSRTETRIETNRRRQLTGDIKWPHDALETLPEGGEDFIENGTALCHVNH